MVNVVHNLPDTLLRHLRRRILLEGRLELGEADHARMVRIDLLESLPKVRHLGLVEHLDQHIHRLTLQL